MIEVNSDKSYLGSEIRKWCEENPEDSYAQNIRQKYYSEEVKFTPSDKVYYFVDYMSPQESWREFRSYNMAGCHLHRDLEKSPRTVYKNS